MPLLWVWNDGKSLPDPRICIGVTSHDALQHYERSSGSCGVHFYYIHTCSCRPSVCADFFVAYSLFCCFLSGLFRCLHPVPLPQLSHLPHPKDVIKTSYRALHLSILKPSPKHKPTYFIHVLLFLAATFSFFFQSQGVRVRRRQADA